VQDNFDHFTHALGLEHATCHLWQSPFNYERQTLFYQPTGLPQPSDGNYNHAVIEQILPVIEASRGRVFLLVTSHKALREFAQLLEKQVNYPLLIQGDMPRALLLARFAELGNAILIGTSSFWEGVDVRGDALSCVIIDRLPFASPGDPVLGARIDNIRKQGGNPFRDYQLPQAVIELKQGVGRLIRDVNDSGVLVICDPRIKGRSYGRIFLNSLPKMPSTTNIKDVEQFFEKDARCV
jgi:ATP-dependent DNA helicase DinG